MAWTFATARKDLPALYRAAKAPRALEWQTIRLWSTCCEVWCQSQKDRQWSISQQIPPNDNPEAAERLRRIDFSTDGFDLSDDCVRFPLFYVEGKGEHASADEIERVEGQGMDACESYVGSQGGRTTFAHAICVVGVRARVFRWASPRSWVALWGDDGDFDLSEYIDLASPDSVKIWSAMNTIRDTCGVELATPADMPIIKPPSSAGVLRSNAVASSSSSQRPAQVRYAAAGSNQPAAQSQNAMPAPVWSDWNGYEATFHNNVRWIKFGPGGNRNMGKIISGTQIEVQGKVYHMQAREGVLYMEYQQGVWAQLRKN